MVALQDLRDQNVQLSKNHESAAHPDVAFVRSALSDFRRTLVAARRDAPSLRAGDKISATERAILPQFG